MRAQHDKWWPTGRTNKKVQQLREKVAPLFASPDTWDLSAVAHKRWTNLAGEDALKDDDLAFIICNLSSLLCCHVEVFSWYGACVMAEHYFRLALDEVRKRDRRKQPNRTKGRKTGRKTRKGGRALKILCELASRPHLVRQRPGHEPSIRKMTMCSFKDVGQEGGGVHKSRFPCFLCKAFDTHPYSLDRELAEAYLARSTEESVLGHPRFLLVVATVLAVPRHGSVSSDPFFDEDEDEVTSAREEDEDEARRRLRDRSAATLRLLMARHKETGAAASAIVSALASYEREEDVGIISAYAHGPVGLARYLSAAAKPRPRRRGGADAEKGTKGKGKRKGKEKEEEEKEEERPKRNRKEKRRTKNARNRAKKANKKKKKKEEEDEEEDEKEASLRALSVDQNSLRHMFSFLDAASLARAGATCRTWREASGHNLLWCPLVRHALDSPPPSSGSSSSSSSSSTSSSTSSGTEDDRSEDETTRSRVLRELDEAMATEGGARRLFWRRCVPVYWKVRPFANMRLDALRAIAMSGRPSFFTDDVLGFLLRAALAEGNTACIKEALGVLFGSRYFHHCLHAECGPDCSEGVLPDEATAMHPLMRYAFESCWGEHDIDGGGGRERRTRLCLNAWTLFWCLEGRYCQWKRQESDEKASKKEEKEEAKEEEEEGLTIDAAMDRICGACAGSLADRGDDGEGDDDDDGLLDFLRAHPLPGALPALRGALSALRERRRGEGGAGGGGGRGKEYSGCGTSRSRETNHLERRIRSLLEDRYGLVKRVASE